MWEKNSIANFVKWAEDLDYIQWLIEEDYIIEDIKELSPEEEDILHNRYINRQTNGESKYFK